MVFAPEKFPGRSRNGYQGLYTRFLMSSDSKDIYLPEAAMQHRKQNVNQCSKLGSFVRQTIKSGCVSVRFTLYGQGCLTNSNTTKTCLVVSCPLYGAITIKQPSDVALDLSCVSFVRLHQHGIANTKTQESYMKIKSGLLDLSKVELSSPSWASCA